MPHVASVDRHRWWSRYSTVVAARPMITDRNLYISTAPADHTRSELAVAIIVYVANIVVDIRRRRQPDRTLM